MKVMTHVMWFKKHARSHNLLFVYDMFVKLGNFKIIN